MQRRRHADTEFVCPVLSAHQFLSWPVAPPAGAATSTDIGRPAEPTAEVRSIHQTTLQMLEALFDRIVANAEIWLAHRLSAITEVREMCWQLAAGLLSGMHGTIAYTPHGISVTPHHLDPFWSAHPLKVLFEQLNRYRQHIPGDPRPLIYRVAA
jgi:hypothetical protein